MSRVPPWIYSRVVFERFWLLHKNAYVGGELGLGNAIELAALLGAAVASQKIKSVLIAAPGTLLDVSSTDALHKWLGHARRERWTEVGKSTNQRAERGIVS